MPSLCSAWAGQNEAGGRCWNGAPHTAGSRGSFEWIDQVGSEGSRLKMGLESFFFWGGGGLLSVLHSVRVLLGTIQPSDS